MKKSLSLILALSMVFSMFASVAFAAEEEMDTMAKFEALVEAGIFQGMGDGDAALDENMTRAQAAVVVAALFDLDTSNPPSVPTFSDVATTHWAYAEIEAAAAAGIINGRDGGEFDPGTVAEVEQGVGYVTAQELAVMLALGFSKVHGVEIDMDATVSGNVASWAQPYVAAAVSWGLLPSATDYTGEATRADLVEATYAAHDERQQYLKPTVESYEIQDRHTIVFTMSDGETVEHELEEGLEPNTETEVTFEYDGEEITTTVEWAVDQGIASFAAVGAKKLEVVMASPMDEDDTEITLKRGNSNVSVKEIEFSEDNTVATIETSGKLVDADYTVTVETEDGIEYTETITVEEEQVDNIEILSEYAPLDRDLDNVVYAYIQVTNQYGEDITEDTSLTIVSSRGDVSHVEDNKFEIVEDDDDEFYYDEKINLSVTHVDSGAYASAVLTVSSPSRVASIEIEGLYNEDGEELKAGGDEQFYLLVNVLDQYGNEVSPADVEQDVHVTIPRDDDIIAYEEITVDGDEVPNFANIDVDGETRLALVLTTPLDEELDGYGAGTTTITIMSKTSGDRDSIEVTVEDKAIVDTISFSRPDYAAVGYDEIIIPVTAIDIFGEEVTDPDDVEVREDDDNHTGLDDLDISPSELEDDYKWRKNPTTDQLELVLDATDPSLDNEDERVTITATTRTGNFETLTFTLREAAEPDVVSGLDDVPKYYAISASETIDAEDIIILDQYGREFDVTEDKLFVEGDDPIDALGTDEDQYQIVIESSNSDHISLNGSDRVVLTSPDDEVTISADDEGSSILTIELLAYDEDEDEWDVVSGSSYTVTFRAVEKEDIADYALEEITHPLKYFSIKDEDEDEYVGEDPGDFDTADRADYDKEVEVKGYLSNGEEVVIPSSYYTVTSDVYSNSNPNYLTGDFSDNPATDPGMDDGDDETYKYTVLVSAEDEIVRLEGEVTVLNEAAEPTTLSLKDDASVGIYEIEKENDSLVSVEADTYARFDKSDVVDIVNAIVKVKDQFDVELDDFEFASRDVVVNVDDDEFDDLSSGDEFQVAVSYKGKVSLSFEIALR